MLLLAEEILERIGGCALVSSYLSFILFKIHERRRRKKTGAYPPVP
jgi:hypothetical protein